MGVLSLSRLNPFDMIINKNTLFPNLFSVYLEFTRADNRCVGIRLFSSRLQLVEVIAEKLS